VLIVICILFAFLTPNFLTQNNIVNVVRQASINIVLAAGMTFVILTGGIDLAVGSVLGFTAVIAVVVSLLPGLSWAAVPIALLAGLVVGVLTGMTVAYIGLPPFIVTLGTYTAIRGAAYLVAGGTTVINSKIGFAWIGNGYVGPVPWLVIIALVVIAVSAFVLHRTILGVHVYAVGGNAQAARLTGIPVPLVLILPTGSAVCFRAWEGS
jgi:ribose transport system permease protein